MRWWAAFAILVLLLLPADTAAARPAAPGPALPAAPGPVLPAAPGPALPAAPGPALPAAPGPTLPAAPGPNVPGSPGPGTPTGGYRWPLAGVPTVTRPFQPPPRPWLPGHRGVDLAGSPGTLVLAAGAGVVAFAGSVAGVGVVSIDHPGGLRTTYEPVTPLVAAGARVVAGQPVGVLLPGHEGCPVDACLHWGLRRGDDYLDPLVLLRLARVRLYPVNVASSPGRAAASRSYSSARL